MKPESSPIPFWYPSEWLDALDKYKREKIPLDAPLAERNLRTHGQRLLLQTWHAAAFGYAFAFARASVFSSLKVRPETKEYSDRDATFSVTTPGGEIHCRPVQLKEFPPGYLNPRVALKTILEQVAIKYPKSHDLIVAVHLNRREHFSTIKTPPLAVGQFWVWGFSKKDHSELFISGGPPGHAMRKLIPYRLGRRLGFPPTADRTIPRELCDPDHCDE